MEAAESLFGCLEQVADPKKARGVRHPFQAILRLSLLGLVCGQTTMAHIALFARLNSPVLKEPLGFVRGHPPHATTISRTLAGVPYEQLQGALTGWVERVVASQEMNALRQEGWFPRQVSMPLKAKIRAFHPKQTIARLYGQPC